MLKGSASGVLSGKVSVVLAEFWPGIGSDGVLVPESFQSSRQVIVSA